MAQKTFSNEELLSVSTYNEYRDTFKLNSWYRSLSISERKAIYKKYKVKESEVPKTFMESFQKGCFSTISIYKEVWDTLEAILVSELEGTELLKECYKDGGITSTEKKELVALKQSSEMFAYLIKDPKAPKGIKTKAQADLDRIVELESSRTSEEFSNNGMILALLAHFWNLEEFSDERFEVLKGFALNSTSYKASWEKVLQNYVMKAPKNALKVLKAKGLVEREDLYEQWLDANNESTFEARVEKGTKDLIEASEEESKAIAKPSKAPKNTQKRK